MNIMYGGAGSQNVSQNAWQGSKGLYPLQRFTEIFSMIQVSEALSQYGPDAIIIIFIGICRWKRHGHWNLTFLILSYTM
jgi:hypothetical protein